MLKKNYPIRHKVQIINTNGSTFTIPFLFKRKGIHLSIDLYNNPRYQKYTDESVLSNLNNKLIKSKFKNFNYYSLLNDKE